MVRSYNLAQRLVIDNDGTLCRITKMFDADGDETKDTADARVVVAKRAKRQWITVKVNEPDDYAFNGSGRRFVTKAAFRASPP